MDYIHLPDLAPTKDLATDHTIEHEWRQIFHQVDGVALYHSRIPNEDVISPESLRAMAPRITESVRLLTPGTPMDVVAYGCTSASAVIAMAWHTLRFAGIEDRLPQFGSLFELDNS